MKQYSVKEFSRRRAVHGLIFCLLMAALGFLGVSIGYFSGSVSGIDGIEKLRMFTFQSNLLAGLCALLCVPYQVDGIRSGNYHMPRWVVYVLYAGISAVAITFLIAGLVMSPVVGFSYMMLESSGLFLHTLNPILAICLFIFIATDHKIPFKATVFGMLPVLVYALIYMVMVFFVGEERGGWVDHYYFDVYIPWPLTLVLIMAVAFLIVTALRVAHNASHERIKEKTRAYYQNSEDFAFQTAEEAVLYLAREAAGQDPGNNDVTVPRRIIAIISEKYGETGPEELCRLYLEEFLGAGKNKE